MKQAKKYIVIYCAVLIAVLISMRIIRNPFYSVLIYFVTGSAGMMIGSVEQTRFQDFIWEKYPLVYCEYKNCKGYKREWFWDYAQDHCRKDATDDPVLLDNCRRYVISCHSTIAFVIGLFIAVGISFIYF